MGWGCDLALAFGLTFSGACQPAAPDSDPLPPEDPSAWSFTLKKQEESKPAPSFPPVVIIKKETVTVPAPAPEPAPAPATPPPPSQSEIAKRIDPIELAARAAYAARAQGAGRGVPVPAALPRTSAAAAALPKPVAAKMPSRPLDLAATVRGTGRAEYQEAYLNSTLPVDNSRMVTTDRYISVIAETGINTQLDGSTGGPAVLQVTRDVFGYHGRNILIPKGSRLVCGFKPLDKIGSTRAPLRCGRILLGGHRAEIFGMRANGTDTQGYLGIPGEVDNRFWERYGTAFILTGISTAVRAATASTRVNENWASRSDAMETGGEELAERLGEITAQTLEQTLNLNPILRVAQGTRLQIRPDTDWYIAPIGQQE